MIFLYYEFMSIQNDISISIAWMLCMNYNLCKLYRVKVIYSRNCEMWLADLIIVIYNQWSFP